MSVQEINQLEQRVLVMAWAGDSVLDRAAWEAAAIDVAVCHDALELGKELGRGAAAVVLTDAFIESGDLGPLQAVVREQPPWSDLLIVLLISDASDSWAPPAALASLGNVTLLPRRISSQSLISTLRTVVRARNHQYQIRQHLLQSERDREAMALSEERFRTALKGSPVVVFNQDRELRYTWMDNVGLGQTFESVVGKRDSDLFERAEDAQRSEAIKRRVLETGVGERQELSIWHQGAQTFWDLAVEPLRDASGQVTGITCAATDVTALKHREQLMRFIATAGVALGHTRDYEAWLQRLARLATVTIADWCVIDLRRDNGQFTRLIVEHADPTKAELAQLLRARGALDLQLPNPVARVLHTREPELIATINDAQMQTWFPDPAQLAEARRFNLGSWMLLPLVVRGQAMGVLSFANAESGRRYTTEDLQTVSELAADAALAIENEGLCRDLQNELAERKRAEEALRDSEQRHRLAARATSDAIWDWDLSDDTIEWSEKFGTLFGHELARIAPTGSWRKSQIHPDDRIRVVASIQKAVQKGAQHWSDEYRFRCADGSYVEVLDRGYIVRSGDGTALRMIGAMLDITDRCRAAEALRISEERFRLAAKATNDAIWDWDLASNRVAWNENITTIFGYPLDQAPQEAASWENLIHPNDRERVLRNVRAAIAGTDEHWTDEYRLRRADGTYANVLDRGFVVRDSEGKPMRMIGAILDVTERKRVEEALRQSEERFRTVAQAMPQIVWTAGADGEIDFFNDRWSQFTGVRCGQEQHWGCKQAIHQQDIQATIRLWHQAVKTGAPYQVEHRVQRRDGRFHWHLSRALPMRDEEGNIIKWFGTATDIHDQKVAEEALKHSQDELRRLNETLEHRVAERTMVAEQRAAQLRVLASELTSAEQRERRRLANILHDHLQQLLVASTMKISMLRNRIQSSDGKQVLQQVKELLSQSIATSRSLTVELSPPVLYDAGLAAALEWLAHWMQEKHALRVEVQADAQAEPFGEDVRAFFFQAVRELLFNVVKHAQTDHARVQMVMDDAHQVRITVEDEGAGIDVGILSCTKLNSGDGFGLFNIRERLELLGGQFHIESQPGKGTRVIMLAAGDQLGQTAQADVQVAAPEAGASGEGAVARRHHRGPLDASVIRVLLADDHQIVREGLMGLIQEHADIVVVGEACDGQMAVEMAMELKPDVVIMDVSMPQLSGIEATRRIVTELPQVRVIGLSMHERGTIADAMRDAGAACYLPKGGPSEPLIAAIRGDVHEHHVAQEVQTAELFKS